MRRDPSRTRTPPGSASLIPVIIAFGAFQESFCLHSQAVQAMKASPYLQLEVLRGAGLELVAGESSGYNSSASSETGEETYLASEADYKDFPAPHSFASTLTRLVKKGFCCE